MAYGPAPESEKLALGWLDQHGREFGLFVGGSWVKPASGEWFDVINPATTQRIARVPQAGKADVDAAVSSVTVARAAEMVSIDRLARWQRDVQSRRIGRENDRGLVGAGEQLGGLARRGQKARSGRAMIAQQIEVRLERQFVGAQRIHREPAISKRQHGAWAGDAIDGQAPLVVDE